MILYLSAQNVIDQLAGYLGHPPEIRDLGLLESAVARPQATGYGQDAYPTLHDKAAALMHSLASNHALVDGNKRAALLGATAMLNLNGWQLTAYMWDLFEEVMAIARGDLDDVPKIAGFLRENSVPIELPLLDSFE